MNTMQGLLVAHKEADSASEPEADQGPRTIRPA